MFDSIGELLGGFGLLICGFIVLAVLMVGMFFRNRARANQPTPTGGLGGYNQPTNTTPRPQAPVVRPTYDSPEVVSGSGFGGPSARPTGRENEGDAGSLIEIDDTPDRPRPASTSPRPASGGFGGQSNPRPAADDDVSSSGGFGKSR